MKKFLLPFLITLSSTILAKTPDSLFGVFINDNILNYVTKEELKSKRKDFVKGFYELRLNNPPVSNKNYSDKLYVIFDKNNKIGEINSQKIFQNLQTCEKVEYGARKALENKYNIEFLKNPNTKYGFDKWVGDIQIGTQCIVSSVDKTTLIILLHSKKYNDKYNEYLNSKI